MAQCLLSMIGTDILQVDHFFISHYHDPEYMADDGEPEIDSVSSVIIRKPGSRMSSSLATQKLLFSNQVCPCPLCIASCIIAHHNLQELENLSALAATAYVSTEIKRYMSDIVVFLRMHRAVVGGISTKATRDFEYLVKFVHWRLRIRYMLIISPDVYAQLMGFNMPTPQL